MLSKKNQLLIGVFGAVFCCPEFGIAKESVGERMMKQENQEAKGIAKQRQTKNRTAGQQAKTTIAPRANVRRADSVEIRDFALDVHVHKTSFPHDIWFVPVNKPVVSLTVIFRGVGERCCNLTHPALSDFLGILWKGAGKNNPFAFAKKLYDAGGSLNYRMGLDNAFFSAWAPVETFETVLELGLDALTRPRLSGRLLKRAREKARSRFAEELNDPGVLLNEAANAQIYPDTHPYRSSLEREGQDIDRLQARDIKEYLTFLGQDNALVVVSGPKDREDEIVQQIERTLQRLPVRGKPLPMFDAQMRTDVQDLDLPFGIPQVMVRMRMDTCSDVPYERSADDPLYFARRLAFAIVAQPSLNSMLFRKIRTELGLAYSCGGIIRQSDLDQSLSFFLGTQRGTFAQAMKAVQDLFAHVVQKGVSREDFEMTKREFLGSLAVSLESSSDFVNYIGLRRLQGFSPEQIRTFMKNYKDVTFEQVCAVAKKLFDHPMTRVSIGSRS